MNYETPQYFLIEEPYDGTHPYFYDKALFPEILTLENNWETIKDEIFGSINEDVLSEIKNLNPPYLSSPDAWKNIYLYNFGWKNHKNCKKFSKTHALLKKIPNLSFGGIIILEPHSKVLPHNGETNTIIRCHMGLKIPAPYPTCGIRVGNEERGWEDGKVVMFSDAHYHSTWNDSSERRYVLVFDIIRPEYAQKKDWICSNVLGALSLKYFYSKIPSLKKIPYPLLQIIHKIFSSIWYLYLPLQNRFPLP